ncbi:hypothetical protein EDC96DRAFT_515682 [Choanephora cucurbitarum]|nr:hypothetical protein EDC96DRAFT_515682 [Choanephora cucurbitarum]
MSHLSDYSFLQRASGLGFLLVWLLYRLFATKGYHCFYLSKLKKGDLKSVVTTSIFIMLPFQLYYDIVTCKIKYEEGFVPIEGKISTKPESLWSAADRDLVIPTDYSLCIGFSMQIGTLLLLQCFWKYLAKMVAKARFMSSKEFKFYILMTALNIILFPLVQYNFSQEGVYDSTLKEIIPQLIYGLELLLISMLGIVSHFRFNKLLGNTYYHPNHNPRSMSHRIKYYQELNLLLSASLFAFSVCFIILSSDGLSQSKTINSNKFASDFLICNVNVLSVVIWMLVVLIIHPKKQNSYED